MIEIQANGGIYINLDFGNDMKHDIIDIPIIQFTIGGCKETIYYLDKRDGTHYKGVSCAVIVISIL